MRLDKFLKLSRLVKRRTVAKELADAGCILVNGKAAKPSTEVAVGDVLNLTLGRRLVEVEVLEIRSHASQTAAKEMTRTLSERFREPPE